jgi:hypothetical protein
VKRKLIVLFVAVALLSLLPQLEAQDLPQPLLVSITSPDWHIPDACLPPNYCRAEISETDLLYLYNVETYQLFVVQPNGVPGIEHNLSGYADLIGQPYVDFLPFRDEYVMFWGLPTGVRLIRYELESREASRIELTGERWLRDCDFTYFLNPITSFFRLGIDDRLLICGVTHHETADDSLRQNIAQIQILDLATNTAQEPIDIGYGYGEVAPRQPPWFKLEGGLDGNIYLYAPTRVMPEIQNAVTSTDHLPTVLRYDIDEMQWDGIEFSAQNVMPAICPVEGVVCSSELVGVDQGGYLYLATWWAEQDEEAVQPYLQVTKLTPQGQVLWQVSRDELGSGRFFLSLLGEDRFATVSRSREGEETYMRINVIYVDSPASQSEE